MSSLCGGPAEVRTVLNRTLAAIIPIHTENLSALLSGLPPHPNPFWLRQARPSSGGRSQNADKRWGRGSG